MLFERLRKVLDRRPPFELPFSPNDLEVMIGKDFYVMVNDIKEKTSVPSFPQGMIAEVISSRRKGVIDIYFLSTLRAAAYENGTAVREGINARFYQDFILTLDKVSSATDTLPRLEGMTVLYSGCEREVDSSPRKMIVEFATLPMIKKYGRIVSF